MIINFSPIIGIAVGVVIVILMFELIIIQLQKASLSDEDKKLMPVVKRRFRSFVIGVGIVAALISLILAPVKQSEMHDAISDHAEINNEQIIDVEIDHQRDATRNSADELSKAVIKANKEFNEFIKENEHTEPNN